jgi:hypothetical protein
MSPALVDQAILSCCKPQFRKAALIVALASTALKVPEGTKLDFVAERIKALVKAGGLQAQGDLDRPRFSEVRLPQK